MLVYFPWYMVKEDVLKEATKKNGGKRPRAVSFEMEMETALNFFDGVDSESEKDEFIKFENPLHCLVSKTDYYNEWKRDFITVQEDPELLEQLSLRCEEREGGFTLIAVAENPATPISVLKRLAETQKENVLRRTLPDDPYIHFYVSVSRIAEIQLEKRTNNN